MSLSHGTVLNLSSVARESQVERKTVDGYLSVLEDLFLGVRIPVFSRHAKRSLIAHSKFFYFDSGVYASLRPRGPLDSPEEMAGPALEGLVMQHLRAWIAYGGKDLTLHYWRTKDGVEVDFVLYGGDGLHAIEVKNTVRVRPEDLRALKSFGQDYPPATRTLLYRGAQRLVTDGVDCMPVDQFLRALRPDQQLPCGVQSETPGARPR